ncbi:MAG TPA: alpha/beta fold hydrolase [Gammaproteobacteria bacterium]|nr:alpha/beta fold hydrolase [Gammaproteobacteria bacterium]
MTTTRRAAARSRLALLLLSLASVLLSLAPAADALAQGPSADGGQEILTIDHYVTQVSVVPSIDGEHTQLYVRERVRGATIARGGGLEGRVALFVHGAGTPAEVAFDVPYEDYSWMAYLAAAGFDVFSVDMTGYGRSTRPFVMNDPCNLAEDAQRELGIGIARDRCSPSHVGATTTIESDWADIDRAVDYIRELRGVDRVHLLGWSLGGPRAGGYAARHADKVGRLVLLAPAYSRDSSAGPPEGPDERAAMSSQSRADFLDYWNTPFNCPQQRDPVAGEVIFSEMLKSDPVGATWGPGIRRAPIVSVWGWNEEIVGRSQAPLLAVAAAHDASVAPERVRELYDDYGASEKVLVDMGCATHGPMWESVHGLLFAASLEWLRSGTVNGESSGVIRMGY